MKALLGTLALALGVGFAAQAARPSIMVMPDKAWCIEKGYVDVSERNGRTRTTENYDRAFADGNLKMAVTAVNKYFAGLGFPTENYGAKTENDEWDEMEDETYESMDGDGVDSDANQDVMHQRSQLPDIKLNLYWKVNPFGMRKTVEYTLEAVDGFTSKNVAVVSGQSPVLSKGTPDSEVLTEGFTDQMDDFVNQLQSYFDDIQANGREITLRLQTVGQGMTFNEEYGGKELRRLVNDWIEDNTVNHQYSQRQATRNRLQYDQVRISYLGENGRPQDAIVWTDKLRDYLKSYGVPSENTSGTGRGVLRVGTK